MSDGKPNRSKTHFEECWRVHRDCFRVMLRTNCESYAEGSEAERAAIVESLARVLWEWADGAYVEGRQAQARLHQRGEATSEEEGKRNDGSRTV